MKSSLIIPNGFVHLCGTENTGFVIQSMEGNQFVWIPGGETREDGYCEGFYFSRFDISMENESTYVSKPDRYPVVDIDYYEAVEIANKLNAKLISDKQFERILSWLLESGFMTDYQIYEDTSEFGNYKNVGPHKMVKTFSNPKWLCNNIDNLAGNLWTWTCTGDDKSKVLRGGCCMLDGNYAPLARKCRSYLKGSRFYTGLRVVL